MTLLTKQITGKKTERILGMIFIPLGILVFLYMLFAGSGSSTSISTNTNSPTKTDSLTKAVDNLDIYISAQEFVRRGLKAPATAKFPVLPYNVVALGDNRYKITSYVDSQNSFGALLRSDWSVVMKKNGDRWQLERMVVDGSVVYDPVQSKKNTEELKTLIDQTQKKLDEAEALGNMH